MRIWIVGILIFIYLASTCDDLNWELCPFVRYKLYQRYFYEFKQFKDELIVDDVPTVHFHQELSVEDFEKYALTIALPLDTEPIRLTLEHDTFDQKACPTDFNGPINDINELWEMDMQYCLCYEDMYETEEERYGKYINYELFSYTYMCGRNYSMICLRESQDFVQYYAFNGGITILNSTFKQPNASIPFLFASKKIKDKFGGHIFHPFAINDLTNDPKHSLLTFVSSHLDQNFNNSFKIPALKRGYSKDTVTGETYTTFRIMPVRYRWNQKMELYVNYKKCLVNWHFPEAKIFHNYVIPLTSSSLDKGIVGTLSDERFLAAEKFELKEIVTPKPISQTTSGSLALVPAFLVLLSTHGTHVAFSWLITPLLFQSVSAIRFFNETIISSNYEKYTAKKSGYLYEYSYEGPVFAIRQLYSGMNWNTVTKLDFEKYSAEIILPQNGTIDFSILHENHGADNQSCRRFDFGETTDLFIKNPEYQSCLCYEDNFDREQERFYSNLTLRNDTVFFCGHGLSMICVRERHILFNGAIMPQEASYLVTINASTPIIYARGKRTDQDPFLLKFNKQTQKKLVKVQFSTAYSRSKSGHVTNPNLNFEGELDIAAPKIRQHKDLISGKIVNTIRVLPVQHQYKRMAPCIHPRCETLLNERCFVTWRFVGAKMIHYSQPWWTSAIHGLGTIGSHRFNAGEPVPRNVTIPPPKKVKNNESEESSTSSVAATVSVLLCFVISVFFVIDQFL